MKALRCFLSLLTCFFILIFASSFLYGFEAIKGQVKDNVNLRKTPELNGKKILTVRKGTTVNIIDAVDLWYHIKFTKGKYWHIGWVAAEFVAVENVSKKKETSTTEKVDTVAETPLAEEKVDAHPEPPDKKDVENIKETTIQTKKELKNDSDNPANPAKPDDSVNSDMTAPKEEIRRADSIESEKQQSNISDAAIESILERKRIDKPENSTPKKPVIKIKNHEKKNDTDSEKKTDAALVPKTVSESAEVIAPAIDETEEKAEFRSDVKAPEKRIERKQALPLKKIDDMSSKSVTMKKNTDQHVEANNPNTDQRSNLSPVYLILVSLAVLFSTVALLFAYKAYSLGQTLLKFTLNKKRQKIIIGDDQYEKIDDRVSEDTERLLQVDFKIDDTIYSGFIYQLSAYKASIYTAELFAVGSSVQLSYCTLDDDKNIRKDGRIIRTHIQGIEVLFD